MVSLIRHLGKYSQLANLVSNEQTHRKSTSQTRKTSTMMSTALQDLRSNSLGTYLTLCLPLSSTNNLLMLLVSHVLLLQSRYSSTEILTLEPQASTMTSNAETRCTPLLTVCLMLTMLPSAPSFWYDPKQESRLCSQILIQSIAASQQDPRTLYPEPHERGQSSHLLWVCPRTLHILYKQGCHRIQTANPRYRPTLMGANSGGSIADAGWQVRVVETILNNTFQIFDDDQINLSPACSQFLLCLFLEYERWFMDSRIVFWRITSRCFLEPLSYPLVPLAAVFWCFLGVIPVLHINIVPLCLPIVYIHIAQSFQFEFLGHEQRIIVLLMMSG